MSLKSISCACSDRPDVCMWYFSCCARGEAPYFSRIATAQMRRATRPMTEYSASRPLKKKKKEEGEGGGEVGREIVNAHAPGEVGLDDDGVEEHRQDGRRGR